MIGRACILFNRERFQEALEQYRKALYTNPRCPASVRVGMAMCFYRLGDLDLAAKALTRALQPDPGNVEANVGVGVLLCAESKRILARGAGAQAANELASRGIAMLKEAFLLDQGNAQVNINLAKVFFDKGDYDMASQRANTAISAAELSGDSELLAEALYERARALHVKLGAPMKLSFNAYLQATQKDK